MAALVRAAFDLVTAPTLSFEGELVRMVSFAALAQRTPPDFLYASGKPNRFNSAGVECVYFAEDEATARAEFARPFRGLQSARQPRTTYVAKARLARVLDLAAAETRAQLGIADDDLVAPWRTATTPTRTQLLGDAVSRQSRVSAIRYPSVAAADAGLTGANVVIFRASLARGDFVEVLGPGEEPLDRWSGAAARTRPGG